MAPNQYFELFSVGGGIRTGGNEQRIDPVADAEVFLQARERNEGRAHVALLRLQREFSKVGGREHRANGQAQRTAEIVLPSVKRLQRDGRGALHAEEQCGAFLGADLARESGADPYVAAATGGLGSGAAGASVELPEPVVDSVDEHV